MKSRFFMLLLGVLAIPAVVRAQIPTLDIPGTIQAATEVGNTLNNVKESITQVEQYQKTMSAIGTAKKTVTEFITNQKEKLQEKMEKIQEYKERVEEYKVKAEAYKAEIEDRVNQAKEKIDEVKDTVNEVKDTVTSTVDEAKDKINEVKDQAESIKGQVSDVIDAAKSKVASAKEQMDEACADPESEACTQATEAYTELENAQAEMESACSDPESEACMQATGVYNRADVAVGTANQDASTVNVQTGELNVASTQTTATAGMAAEIVDTPVAQPSRQPIAGIVSSTAEATSGIEATAVSAQAGTAAAAQKVQSAAQAVEAAGSTKAVSSAAVGSAAVKTDATVATKVSPVKATAVTAQTSTAATAQKVQSAAQAVEAAGSTKAVSSAAAGSTAVKTDATVATKVSPAKATAATAIPARTGTAAAVKTVSSQTVPLKAATEAVSVSGQSIKQDANTAVESIVPTKSLNAAPTVQRPTRATFKTSFGYGRIRQVYPLAFASLSLDIGESQGGVTANNVLVVPEAVSLECDNLNFEDAAEDGNMDKCLRQLNDKALSKVSNETSKTEIVDAEKALNNGLAEYMAAAYFEAMNIYNESITFKNNVIDPAITAEVPDVQTAWKYSLDVSTSMGTRINALSRMWARSLTMKTYKLYQEKGLRTE